jgi:molybdenum cofactor biosynthesis protein B
LTNAGHKVAAHDILPDDLLEIRRHVEALCSKGLDAIITTGGTGIAARDQTPEALLPLLEKRLDGFAELFRWLSVQEVGPVATLSRAFAGTWAKTIIFSLPGSPKAVRLAMEKLILPILPHAVALLRT